MSFWDNIQSKWNRASTAEKLTLAGSVFVLGLGAALGAKAFGNENTGDSPLPDYSPDDSNPLLAPWKVIPMTPLEIEQGAQDLFELYPETPLAEHRSEMEQWNKDWAGKYI